MRVAVAFSGGVDSSMAAALLVEQGLDVLAVHMDIGQYGNAPDPPARPAQVDAARAMALVLGIPFHSFDLRREFASEVLTGFAQEYHRGRTPSPCMICNRRIKFGSLWERAQILGAELLATGHYARIVRDTGGVHHLLRGVDRRKDQSYFLAMIGRGMLDRSVFPLGGLTKVQVRSMARQRGLPAVDAAESQDLCFLGDMHYLDFLSERGECGQGKTGPIVNLVTGEVLGQHRGIHRFTIGQRRGLRVGGSAEPLHVVEIEAESGRVLVGPRSALLSASCDLQGACWLAPVSPGDEIEALVQVRYRHSPVQARVEVLDGDRARVFFDRPEASVAPGQAAVVYAGDEVLGGGWIGSRERA